MTDLYNVTLIGENDSETRPGHQLRKAVTVTLAC